MPVERARQQGARITGVERGVNDGAEVLS